MFFESNRDNGYYLNRGDNYCFPHLHKSAEILYILSGEKRVIIDDQEITLVSGDMLVCPPYTLHVYYKNKEGGEQIVATVLPNQCEKFMELCSKKRPEKFVLKDTDGEIAKIIKTAEKAVNEIYYTGAVSCLLGLFVAKVRFLPKDAEKKENIISDIAEYIENNYMNKITLSSISGVFGYSPSYFSSFFKKNFIVGLTKYVNLVRVKKAIPMLKRRKISTVCYEVGFQSPQQFFLNFKRYYGKTPREVTTE